MSDGIVRHRGLSPGASPHWLARATDLAVAIGTPGLLAVTLAPFLHPFWPLASVVENFALQALIGAVLLGALALIRRCRLWLAVALTVLIFQIATIHPYWPLLTVGNGTMEPGFALKVVTLNVWARGTSYDEVRRYLIDSNADVIGLVEASPLWRSELAPLNDLYPHRIECGEGKLCRQILLSRYPFARHGIIAIEESYSYLTWGEIRPPGAGGMPPVTVALTHLTRPFYAGPPDRGGLPNEIPNVIQALEADRLADHLRELGPDLVLMGDFNAAPWSRIQQRLRRTTQLDNAGQLAPSWPAWAPVFLRLPIDHVLARGAIRIARLNVGPDVGSDHRPVEASLALAAKVETVP